MTNTTAQFRDEFSTHYGLAWRIAQDGLRYSDGTVPPDVEELIHEAIAHAWVRFERICKKHPNAPAKSRVRWAAKSGVLRVRSGRRFVATRERGYVDAMDHRSQEELLDAQDKPATGYRDPSDNSLAEVIIAKLPGHLQAIARLFSYGLTKEQVAERRRISRSTLYMLIGELRQVAPKALPEPKPIEIETEPVRRFCPVRAMVTTIAIEYERNRCYRPLCVVHADPHNGNIVLEDRR